MPQDWEQVRLRTFNFGKTPSMMRRGFELSWRKGWGFEVQIWNVSIFWHYGARKFEQECREIELENLKG